MTIYYRETTFQQRKYLFELVERLGNVSEACRRAKVSRKTYYLWKPRYESEGIEGLREPRSHALHNPHTIDPHIQRRIIELKREHPNWGKKRIAQWIWKEYGWKRVVAIETVRNVLNRHGLWKNGKRKKKKKKRKNRGTTADSPDKTINIDLCFLPAKEVHEPNFSAFFQRMDELCEKSTEKGEESALTAKDSGLAIFSHEKMSYDEKMDAYVLMRNNKEDKREDSKKANIGEVERKAGIKWEEEELRAWRRRMRIERKREDEEWRRYREERLKLKKSWEEMPNAERFIERLKEMLAEREWKDVEELMMVLEEVISAYNDAPHQGLDGLSPNEYERRLMCVASG